MNLVISIFGGMALTALLYGLGRRLRLSNFWAAVSAAALPSFAYMLYATWNWAGMDVLTLHVVAYPTVAVLLSQLYGAKADHSKSLHWAPKLMVLFFVAVSAVMGALVYISSNGLPPALAAMLLPNIEGKVVHTGFAGVVEHDQGAAKEIGYRLKMQHRIEKLGWTLDVNGISRLHSDATQAVVLKIMGEDGRGVDGVEAVIHLARPGVKGDMIRLPMVGSAQGEYHGLAPRIPAGTWIATLVLRYMGQEIVLDHTAESI